MGNLKILAGPEENFFSDFKIQIFHDIFQKAKKYFSNTVLTETIHEPGSFEIDKHIGSKTIEDIEGRQCHFEEQTVKAGDMCLIFGIYCVLSEGNRLFKKNQKEILKFVHPFINSIKSLS